MILIDENFPDSQRQLLQGWRISFEQVGNSTPKKNYRSIGTNDLADKLSALTGLAPDLSTGGKRQLGGRLKVGGVVCLCRTAGGCCEYGRPFGAGWRKLWVYVG